MHFGFYLIEADYNKLHSNTAVHNTWDGIYIHASNHNTICNGMSLDNGRYDIFDGGTGNNWPYNVYDTFGWP